MSDKDIRFSEKKVDDSWKEQVETAKEQCAPKNTEANKPPEKTSKLFLGLLQSLGYQALMHLGEIPDPTTQERTINSEGAKEAIELLMMLKDKTADNLSDDEKKTLETLLTQLQIKFSQVV